MSAEQFPESRAGQIDAAVIYCRVSTTKQTIEGHGLQSQEVRCREYAEQHGYDVLAVFPDDVSGGGDFMGRPGMVALLSFLKAQPDRRFAVIFDDLKRFARDAEFHIKLRRELNTVGAKVECLNFKFEDTPEGEFIETIMAAQGELERKQNRRQVIQKMKARVQAGYYLFAPVYGYRYEKVPGRGRMLVPDEPAASIVREAFAGMAHGRFRSIGDVKHYLDEHSNISRCSNGGAHWSVVSDILRRKLYTGLITVKKWGIVDQEGIHEPLVSLADWLRVQDVLDGKAMAPRRKDINEDFPLRGFVCCADCGAPMTSCWSKSRNGVKHPYYLCAQKACPSKRKSIRRDDLETAVARVLERLVPAQKLSKLAGEMFQDIWNNRAAQSEATTQSLLREASQLQKQIDKLIDRLVNATGDSVIEAYEQRIAKMQQDKKVLMERINNLAVKQDTFSKTFEHAMRFLSNPYKVWEKGSFDLKRNVLNLVFSEPLVYCRNEGLRTAKTALPFKVLGDFSTKNLEVVGDPGIEPGVRLREGVTVPCHTLRPVAHAADALHLR